MIEVPLPNKRKDLQKTRVHRYKDLVSYREIYNKYVPNTALMITYMQYKKILNKFFKYGMEDIIKGIELRVPILGYFVLYKMEQSPRHKCINYNETKLANKAVYYDNAHSNGYVYKVRWHRTLGNKTRKYAILLSRDNKETLATKIKDKTITI